jgi:hypothetical protein
MKHGLLRYLLALVAAILTASAAEAQQYYWSNFAGQPGSGGSGDGTGNAVQFNAPYATAIDSSGNIYVADSGNSTIRKMTLSGTSWVVTTLAGSPGNTGSADGSGGSARFNIPTGVAVDSSGNVYVADSGNLTIRKVTSGGDVTTLAGTPGQTGLADGTGSAALFGCPSGVAVDSGGNVYVADSLNHVIRKVTTGGAVTTFAGIPGQPGYADGSGNAALFNTPTGVAVDGSGNVYVADNLNHVIRKITSSGVVSTLAGTPVLLGTFDGTGSAAMFNYPASVAVDSSGNVYVADSCNHSIRKVTAAGTVTTLAGTIINRTGTQIGSSASPGFADSASGRTMFNYPYGVGVDGSGSVYVADTFNNAIRKVSQSGNVTTIAGSPNQPDSTNGTGSGARFSNPSGITVDSGGNIYVADTNNSTLRMVTSSSVVTLLAGQANITSTRYGISSVVRFNYPSGAAADGSGHVYVADTYANTIRRLTLSGTVVDTISGSVSGNVGAQGSADGTGTVAMYNNPTGIAVDASGNIYVADSYNSTLRNITLTGTTWVTTTLVGSPGVTGTIDGTGSAVRLNYPSGVAVDSGTNIYVADSSSYTIRKITLSGTSWVSTTLAGTPGVSGSADGLGSAAQFGYPTGIAVDSGSNVYIADNGNCTIRKITPAGLVTTIGGTPGVAGSMDGIGSAGLFSNPYSLTVDAKGNVYVADSGNNRISVGSSVDSGSASSISGNGATLNGWVNPNGASGTSVYFQYGTTTAYATGTTASQALSSGTNFVSATAMLSGLSSNTTYHYRLVEVTANGTFYGMDQTFVTPPTAAPSISSAAATTGTVGTAFSFQIVASNKPTGYGVDRLPAGLTLDPTKGIICGTPTAVGQTSIVLSATNAVGTSSQTFTLTIVAMPLPAITSATTQSGVLGVAFNYTITATNSPTSYTATGLPAGLPLNPATGLISGIPMATGTFAVTIGAVNASGTTTTTFTLTVSPAYYWSNFAGSPRVAGSADGTGSKATFYYPYAVTVDSAGNLYVADTNNSTIRKVTPAGVVTTLAGIPGVSGSANGTGTAAQFNNPVGIAVDSGSNLYVADTLNHTIRKMTPAGVVTTLAGTPGVYGSANGTGTAAQFFYPRGIAVDSGSNLYVADSINSTIRKVTPAGVVTTLAGSPTVSGSANGTGSAAQFNYPSGVAVDSGSNIYVADTGNYTIRKVTPAGVVTTLAGIARTSGSADGLTSAATFNYPSGIAVDGIGNLFVAESNNYTIREISLSGSNLVVTTIGGSVGSSGTSDGIGTAAPFFYPSGVCVDSGGNVYVADTSNTRIAKGYLVSSPAITSGLTATAVTGSAFSYQITASNSPTSYGASGLPDGLSINTATGLISGTPTTSGTTRVTITATNPGGTGSATLVITITLPPPAVTTGSTGTVYNGATINGAVNPNGLPTTCYFNYGLTSAYGSSTTPQTLGSGTSAVSFNVAITGLRPSTTYHYQLVATNSSGTTYGPDQTFTTTKALDYSTERAQITKSGTNIQISVKSVAGYSYQLQRADTLGSPTDWQNIGDAQPGTDAIIIFDDSVSDLAKSMFYRVQISQ